MVKLIQNNNILIISSHADDHISCSGTILKLQEERGLIPYEVVLTDSSRGQDFRANKQESRIKVSRVRSTELSEASKFLGVRKTFLMGAPDLGLAYQPKLLFKLAKVIRKIKPSIIFINGEYDAHPDHRISFRIALDAIKLSGMGVETEKLGPSFRVPVILCVEQMLPDRIQMVVDITKFKDKKDQLLKIYQSQMSPKSLAFEQGMLAVRGYHLRKPDGFFAEAFTFQNEFPILGFEDNETNIF